MDRIICEFTTDTGSDGTIFGYGAIGYYLVLLLAQIGWHHSTFFISCRIEVV
jgi:hypothetical protein